MKFSSNPLFRESEYNEIINQCLVTRATRVPFYDMLRNYYLFGSGTGTDIATYNKIYPSIDTLVSFLFAVDTTRFTIKLSAEAPKSDLIKIPPLVQRLNDKWEDSNADLIFSGNVSWSLVFGTTLVKLLPRGKEVHPFLVMPYNFGVLNEAQPMLDRQEAFVHTYVTTRAQLNRDLVAHPRRNEFLQRITEAPAKDEGLSGGAAQLIVNNLDPLPGPYSGNVNAGDVLGMHDMYRSETRPDCVEMRELWVWDDNAEDTGHAGPSGQKGGWRVITQADPDICIYDREAASLSKKGDTLFLAGDHPFTQVCPNPAPDYFWGYSEVQRLVKLQDLREKHLMKVDELVDRACNSAKALMGQWGAMEEKDFALQRLGALLGSTDPTAKIEEFKPQIPADLWAVVNKIDEMFDEMISLSNLSKGHGDTGVRSKGQTESLLRVGSSRPKKRALTIEDSIERIATQYLRLDQAHNPDKLHMETEDGKKIDFISEQFTKDYVVRVDAHSSSPVFVEDQKQMALELFKLQVIDGEELLNMLQPQNLQILKEKYKKMAKQRAQQQQQEQAIEAAGKLRSVKG